MLYKRVNVGYFKINPKYNWKPVKGPEDWCDMLRFSGSSQNAGSSVLDELQLSNGLLGKAGEETITILLLLVIKA